MSTVIFRGAFIRHADLRHEGEAGKFVRLHVTADFSDPVREYMGWPELSATFNSAKLSGDLTGGRMVLTPNGTELQAHELQLSVLSVADFSVVRVKNQDGESTRTELRFAIRTGQPDAGALIEAYIAAIGRGDGQLKIVTEEQASLDLEASEADTEASDSTDAETEE